MKHKLEYLLANNDHNDHPLEFATDQQTLDHYSSDFGGIISTANLAAIAKPYNLQQLSQLIKIANEQHLKLTLRGFGLSQSGQAIAVPEGIIVDMAYFNNVASTIDSNNPSLTVAAAASWRDVVNQTLPHHYLPYVLPFNLDLSVGGVLSAGGFGAATMRQGVIAGHLKSLEVTTADGNAHQCSPVNEAELFYAVLAGVGRFGAITQAEIKLRQSQPYVRTFYLLYDDYRSWIADQFIVQQELQCEYMEAFCTPCVQGMRNNSHGRVVFPYWFYSLQLSYEYTNAPPQLSDMAVLKYYKHIHTEDNTMLDFVNRHQSRFDMMKRNGSWQQLHPWYECFVSAQLISELLPEILQKIPLYLGGIYHLFPINSHFLPPYLMVPEDKKVMAFAVLTPGISVEMLPATLQLLEELDEMLLTRGCKRYLSGWLNCDKHPDYWQRHYSNHYTTLVDLKTSYDPNNVWSSRLTGL